MAGLKDFTLSTDEAVAGISFITDAENYTALVKHCYRCKQRTWGETKELIHQQGFVASIEKKSLITKNL